MIEEHKVTGGVNDDDDMAMSVLVVSIDYRYDLLQSPEQPLIRVFGSNHRGQRVCCNVRGVFPYLYVRPENMSHAAFTSEASVCSLLLGIGQGLEDLLHSGGRHDRNISHTTGCGSGRRRRARVCGLEVERKKTLYGMYVDEFFFVKVVLFNPLGEMINPSSPCTHPCSD